MIIAAVLLGVGIFQAWFLGLAPRNLSSRETTHSLTDVYVEGLAKGQSYLPVDQDPNSSWESQKYRILDASYYGKRVYLYFGIVPFVLLMLPWHALTGTFLSQGACIFAFLQAGYLAYAWALCLINRGDRRLRMDLLVAAGVLAAIAGSGTLSLTARPAIYEIEGAGAYACLAIAVAFLVAALASKRGIGLFLGLASLFTGLTLGCRPNYLPAAVVLSLSVGVVAWKSEAMPARGIRRVASCWIPLAVVGVALALWNYRRFSGVTEFGYSYTGFAQDKAALVHWSPGNLLYNLHRYLLGGIRLGGYFPFIEGAREGPILRPAAIHEPFDQVYGCLFLLPILLYSLLALLRRNAAAALLVAAGAGNLLLLSGLGFGTYRYPADYLGAVSFAAGIGICLIPAIPGKACRLIVGGLLLPLLAWSAVGCVCSAAAVARTTALFEEQRPKDFSLLARPFNAVAYRVEAFRRAGPAEVRLHLAFPTSRFGAVEPILVVGEAGLQDFVYAYYNRPGEVEIGFESIGYGGPLSAPTKIDYGKPHVVDISLGSLLPPDDHPLLKGMPGAELSLSRGFVRVAIDGKPVLESGAHLHRVRARVFVGESPDNGAFGTKFTGEILAVERPLLRGVGVYPQWRADQFGPIAMSLRLQPMPAGTRQPLICLGYRPTGAMLFIENLPSGKIRLGWMAYNRDAVYSSPLDWDREKAHALEFHAGSLLPPLQSDLWPASASDATRADSKLDFLCKVDGREIWEMRQETPDAAPPSVTTGWNSTLQSGVADSLDGDISSVRREPW
jgi:hypothetical protein